MENTIHIHIRAVEDIAFIQYTAVCLVVYYIVKKYNIEHLVYSSGGSIRTVAAALCTPLRRRAAERQLWRRQRAFTCGSAELYCR